MAAFYSTTPPIPPDHFRTSFHAVLQLTDGDPIAEPPLGRCVYRTIVETESTVTGMASSLSVAAYVHNIPTEGGWQLRQKVEAQGFLVVDQDKGVSLAIDATLCVLRPVSEVSIVEAPSTLWCLFTGVVKRELTRDHEQSRLCRWDIEILQPDGVPTVTGQYVLHSVSAAYLLTIWAACSYSATLKARSRSLKSCDRGLWGIST